MDITISIHALVKRATLSVRPLQFSHEYFNPRPRKEGDRLIDEYKARIAAISIHALVKRATRSKLFVIVPTCISIHALVKRATDCDNHKIL